MSNIRYNGVKLEDYGIIVEKIPPIIKSKNRIKTYTIPGRDGVLWIDDGTHEPFNLSLECHFDEDNTNINDINNIFNVSGKLSLDGIKYYDAFVNNNIEFEKVQFFRKFILSFLCNPIAHSIVESSFTYDTSGSQQQEMEYNGNAKTWPIIEIEGTGQLIVAFNYTNHSSIGFTLNANGNGKYVVDCEAKEITQNGINKSADMSGDFPSLFGDNVYISVSGTGTLTSLVVKYHTAYL